MPTNAIKGNISIQYYPKYYGRNSRLELSNNFYFYVVFDLVELSAEMFGNTQDNGVLVYYGLVIG